MAAFALAVSACAEDGALVLNLPSLEVDEPMQDDSADQMEDAGTPVSMVDANVPPPTPQTMEEMCADRPPPADLRAFETCPLCANAHCVPDSVPPAEVLPLLPRCDAARVCLPDRLASLEGLFSFTKCESMGGAEGRCASSCIAEALDLPVAVPAASCGAGELCVPCSDPFTGTDTGLCGISCDAPATEAPVQFAACCDDGSGTSTGWCVPPDNVSYVRTSSLFPEGECSEPGQVCAPLSVLEKPGMRLAECKTKVRPCADITDPNTNAACVFSVPLFSDVSSFAEDDGACTPRCIAETYTLGTANPPAKMGELFEQGDCDPGSLCIPCRDPTDGSIRTGVCD